MTELGNYSLKKCGVVFTVFLLKAWLPECYFQAGALLPVWVVTASLTLWQRVGGKCGIIYTVSAILLASTWNTEMHVPVSFLRESIHLVECLWPELPLWRCRADTRSEDTEVCSCLVQVWVWFWVLGSSQGGCTKVLTFPVGLCTQQMREGLPQSLQVGILAKEILA